ncbi:hypothetical protein LZ198_37305 [Myxococcus sp. K15C18031901]|uniref:DUF3885 domain-containing protein n=1 Tax=Myxococcus dinghuensis TaxID=2906761 RepID=UPI0020A6F8B5|nr:hypothetical protein [Myxococcus dinghuensis]MCP3104536.1 hypothetical protein [Myxococcus dinghuensis]
MDDFERWFRNHFGTTAPVGYCLRADHHERWVRLHSLPESKRYAEDASERAEVRRRAWAAASEVLPTGSPVWLVVPTFEPEHQGLQSLSLAFEDAGRYEHELFEEPLEARVARTTWPHTGFDQLIDEVAADALRAVWFSMTSGEVFAPYDGGIDLIVESARRAGTLRKVFPPDWFSKRTDGF